MTTGAGDLLARALSLVAPGSIQAARLEASYASVLLYEGRMEDGREAVGRALDFARRQQDRDLELRARVAAAEIEFFNTRAAQMLEHALAALDLTEQVDDSRAEMQAHYWTMVGVAQQGELEKATRHAEAAVAAAERLRHHFHLSRAIYGRAWVAAWRGAWEEGLGWAHRGLEVSPVEPRLLFIAAVMELQRGDYEAARRYCERLAQRARAVGEGGIIEHIFLAWIGPLFALVSGETDLLDPDEEPLARRLGMTDSVRFLTGEVRTLLALVRADPVTAAVEYEALLTDDHRAFLFVATSFCRARLLGLLARTLGPVEAAAAHFEDALAFCRRTAYPAGLAWTLYDYADLLLRDDQTGHQISSADRARAMVMLDEALQIARELGMRPLLERVLARRGLLSA